MNFDFSLQDKFILVTGASSGIGREICKKISEMGGIVIATGRNEIGLEETLKQLAGYGHKLYKADLTNSETLDELLKNLPKLQGVVHSAGILKYVPFKFINQHSLREMQNINYEAPILLTQMLLRNKLLDKRSSVIFISSVAGMVGTKANSLYAGTKGALVAITKSLALEVAPQQIRVNCISPGIINTRMTSQMEENTSSEKMLELGKLQPLGIGEPKDVANAAVFLLSEAASWITGSNLIVDGGYTCQ